MNRIADRLLTLKIADVMSRRVSPVSPNQTMGQAAAVLTDQSVSGAPVVDETGECVGMLSSADFVRWQAGMTAQDECARGGEEHPLTHNLSEEPFHIDSVDAARVHCHMSSAVQSISATETLLQGARMMCAEHVHRLPVLNEHGHPMGIVTSLDIVAALVNAVDE